MRCFIIEDGRVAKKDRAPARGSVFAFFVELFAVFDNAINETVFDSVFGRHEVIAIGVFFDLSEFLAGVFGEDFV